MKCLILSALFNYAITFCNSNDSKLLNVGICGDNKTAMCFICQKENRQLIIIKDITYFKENNCLRIDK